MSWFRSMKFTATTPEECWTKFYDWRLGAHDCNHYPEVDHFWEHDVADTGDYTLTVIYGYDPIPNM